MKISQSGSDWKITETPISFKLMQLKSVIEVRDEVYMIVSVAGWNTTYVFMKPDQVLMVREFCGQLNVKWTKLYSNGDKVFCQLHERGPIFEHNIATRKTKFHKGVCNK